MKKTFLFLTALAMSAMMWAETATYTKVTSNPTDWSGDYILVYEVDGAARVFTGVDAANDFVEATISDNTITGEFVTLTLETTDGGYLVKINGGDNDGKYISHSANSNGLSTGTSGAVMTMSYDESVLMTNAGGAVMRYNKTSGQDRFRFYKATSYTGQQPVQLYKAGSTPTPATLEGIVIKGEASKLEYFVGDSFDPAGLEVWGIYTKTVKGDSTSQIKSGITWTCDPEVFALGNTSVNVTATYKDKTSAPFTVNNIVVKEKVVPTGYAGVYTSNVELTTEGGTSATAVKVKINGTEYDAIKAGTGKVKGACVVSIPAATKMLHFHAAAWNKEVVKLDVNGTTYDLVADAAIAGSGTSYELQNNPATQDYFTFDPKGATTITFTASADAAGFRFVLFGVNAELEQGVVAAPAFNPTATDFDGSIEVTLTCETEGADIFYAIGEEVTSMNAQQYTEPIKLTAKTTIYAVAKKDGKESEQVNKTYSLIPAYTLAELVAAGAPTADKKKVILVLENEVITGVDGTRGIYVKSGDQEVEIFCYNLPETAVKGAYVSGRAMGDWFLFGTKDPKTWELQPADWSWATFTKDPTALQQVMQNANIRKAMHNGRMFILKDNKMFDLQGMLVK